MLTIEQQKRLTEFLGEKWEEKAECPRIGGCLKINCGPQSSCMCDQLAPIRLDFSDWRVVGRLIEKMNRTIRPEDKVITFTLGLVEKEAICLAIDSYLKEREGK